MKDQHYLCLALFFAPCGDAPFALTCAGTGFPLAECGEIGAAFAARWLTAAARALCAACTAAPRLAAAFPDFFFFSSAFFFGRALMPDSLRRIFTRPCFVSPFPPSGNRASTGASSAHGP